MDNSGRVSGQHRGQVASAVHVEQHELVAARREASEQGVGVAYLQQVALQGLGLRPLEVDVTAGIAAPVGGLKPGLSHLASPA